MIKRVVKIGIQQCTYTTELTVHLKVVNMENFYVHFSIIKNIL